MATTEYTTLAKLRKSKQDCVALLMSGDGVNNSIELMTRLRQYSIISRHRMSKSTSKEREELVLTQQSSIRTMPMADILSLEKQRTTHGKGPLKLLVFWKAIKKILILLLLVIFLRPSHEDRHYSII